MSGAKHEGLDGRVGRAPDLVREHGADRRRVTVAVTARTAMPFCRQRASAQVASLVARLDEKTGNGVS